MLNLSLIIHRLCYYLVFISICTKCSIFLRIVSCSFSQLLFLPIFPVFVMFFKSSFVLFYVFLFSSFSPPSHSCCRLIIQLYSFVFFFLSNIWYRWALLHYWLVSYLIIVSRHFLICYCTTPDQKLRKIILYFQNRKNIYHSFQFVVSITLIFQLKFRSIFN